MHRFGNKLLVTLEFRSALLLEGNHGFREVVGMQERGIPESYKVEPRFDLSFT